MAKLTVHKTETPTEAVVKAANETVTVIDARGRKIEIRKMRTLDRMRLFEVVGSDNAKNEQYFGYAALAWSVVSIDGEPIGRLTTKMQIEAVVQRLDDDGFLAVATGMSNHFLVPGESADEAKELVKNG
jgi:hypothetical protein